MVKLREIAHSRAGDKGDDSCISVIAYHEKTYPFLVERLTAEKVKSHFGQMVRGQVERYEMPTIGALNFVMRQALGGGVTQSLRLDRHGKTYSGIMLDIELDEEG